MSAFVGGRTRVLSWFKLFGPEFGEKLAGLGLSLGMRKRNCGFIGAMSTAALPSATDASLLTYAPRPRLAPSPELLP